MWRDGRKGGWMSLGGLPVSVGPMHTDGRSGVNYRDRWAGGTKTNKERLDGDGGGVVGVALLSIHEWSNSMNESNEPQGAKWHSKQFRWQEKIITQHVTGDKDNGYYLQDVGQICPNLVLTCDSLLQFMSSPNFTGYWLTVSALEWSVE